VVGVSGDDVFVELGPRMQGVISLRKFEEPPQVGDVYEFTLRGREESLWVLSLREEQSLVSWERMEPGTQVDARVVRHVDGGLQLKVGPLHGFMPRSHTGLPRGESPAQLVGRTLTCEVLEVEAERQRVLLSRKLVLERERLGQRQREVSALRPGTVVQGRVTRIESYGAFVRFGAGLSGLIHVSNLAHERVGHPKELLRLGQHVRARVLYVRDHGKKIALGLKQMEASPWTGAAARYEPGRILPGVVTRVTDFGAFVELERGLEGLVHRSETGLAPDRALKELLLAGQPVSVRVRDLDEKRERLSLSLLHTDGSRIAPEEAAGDASYRERAADAPSFESPLGAALRKALGDG
jgi:ribosomal protein S1